MQGLKKFGLVVAVGLFGPLFLLAVFSYSFRNTLGDKSYTKKTVADAGLYTAVGDAIVERAVGEAGGDPLITTALQSAVSGDRIQSTLEPLIDGTYSWLDGSSQQPTFSLQIQPIKDNFQQSLTAALQARAASLPACSYATPLSGEDIYSYNCIPPGTDVNTVINDAVSRVMMNASVFSDQAVSDGSLSTEEASQLGVSDPTQNLPNALPKAYQFLMGGFWYFVAGAVLMTVGIILLSKQWLYGIRKLGVLLLINGFGLALLGIILGFLVSTLVPTASVESTEASVNAIEQVSRVVLADNASLYKLVGVMALVVGTIAVIAASVVLRKKQPKGEGEIDTRPPGERTASGSNPPTS